MSWSIFGVMYSLLPKKLINELTQLVALYMSKIWSSERTEFWIFKYVIILLKLIYLKCGKLESDSMNLNSSRRSKL